MFDFIVGDSYLVDVTHINNPHSFYVRPENVEDYMAKIEMPGCLLSPQEIQYGQRVVYKSNALGKYVRGDIRFIMSNEEGQEFDIFAIDYGCFEKSIQLGQIYSLDTNAVTVNQFPALAVHCQLYLCESKGEDFTENVIDAMRNFIGEHTASITVISKTSDKLVVELRTVDCPCDISTMLGLLHLTTLTNDCNTVHRFYNSAAPPQSSASAWNLTQILNYKHRSLKVGDKLHVRIQSGKSLSSFFVAEMDEYKKYIKELASFSMYCKDRQLKDEFIVPGRPCAVRVGNPPIYERAIILEIQTNSMAKLKLVDWGKDVVCHFTCIKSVASEIYFAQPILAIHCSTDEDQVWESSLTAFLLPGYEFVIKIMKIGTGFNQPHGVNIYPLKM